MSVRCYEEYENNKEKRQVQKGAKRMQPTGKARGYILVFRNSSFICESSKELCFEAVASIIALRPGEGLPIACFNSVMMGSTSVSHSHLRDNCRSVGLCHIPDEWKSFFKQYIN